MANHPDDACPFCAIVRGDASARVVYRTPEVVAFFPLEPATVGHTLVVPVRHVPDLWSLDDTLATLVTRATRHVATAVRGALEPDGLNLIQSNGKAATQTVEHLHVHVLPRWVDDAVGDFWPSESPWDAARLDAARAAIEART